MAIAKIHRNFVPHFNFKHHIQSCQLGRRLQGHQPTARSIGVAIRPSGNSNRPILRFYLPTELLENADFYIGDTVIVRFSEHGTHLRIQKDPDGYRIYKAANRRGTTHWEDAVDGTQYPARFNCSIPEDLMDDFKFKDVCTVFVEPDYIRKGKIIDVPLDDLPIFPAPKANKKINPHKD